ncbi:septum formation initiator family protein [Paenibacillus chibensis]|uniref:Septum formation initiator family protein n=1 Tax=Paenibacillus chibensis TaxID=59846 RepID=A0ABU6PZK3_9BACL|nr:septum formation initiator family protein [Paenibacillus chibensis]MEC0373211.1 septum formation initiator family protein [Paenibacillus chibensis]MED5019550.1 septum formation initiator family protein [Paenibacillus chibensis]
MGKYAAKEQARTKTARTTQESKTVKSAGARRRIMIWVSFMVVFMSWAGYTYISQQSQISAKSAELSKKKVEHDTTKNTEMQLNNDVKRLNDPEYIGQLARKNFGMYLPGETPIHTEETSP